MPVENESKPALIFFPLLLTLPMNASSDKGWTLAQQGQAEEGIIQIRQALVAWQAAGAGWGQPYWLALLAEAYRKAGQAEAGLRVLAEALAAVDKTGERIYEAELYRLKGTLTLQSKVPSRRRSPSVFSQSHRNRSAAECKVVGVTSSDEPEPAVAGARQERRGSADVGGGLRLVY